MAWFRNHYHCGDCGSDWDDEWSCCCDDECSNCRSPDWSPVVSDDLTFVVALENDSYAVFESPITAEDNPCYMLIAVALTAEGAKEFIKQHGDCHTLVGRFG